MFRHGLGSYVIVDCPRQTYGTCFRSCGTSVRVVEWSLVSARVSEEPPRLASFFRSAARVDHAVPMGPMGQSPPTDEDFMEMCANRSATSLCTSHRRPYERHRFGRTLHARSGSTCKSYECDVLVRIAPSNLVCIACEGDAYLHQSHTGDVPSDSKTEKTRRCPV